jgi:hypothetical protein
MYDSSGRTVQLQLQLQLPKLRVQRPNQPAARRVAAADQNRFSSAWPEEETQNCRKREESGGASEKGAAAAAVDTLAGTGGVLSSHVAAKRQYKKPTK